MLVNNDWVNRVPKLRDFPFSFRASIKKRVIKMAVKSDVAIPINKVVANPLMGPVPKTKRINAVSPVVILASKIEDSALLNPSEMAFLRPLPFLSSSLTLSKINTFASTDIPMVNTIPAIPGSVSVACNALKAPKIKMIFTNNAPTAKIPKRP